MLNFLALFGLLSLPMGQGMPPIGIIDFYGLHRVSEAQVRQAIHIKEGDAPVQSPQAALLLLKLVNGVADARMEYVCCQDGKTVLFVGVQEKGVPALKFRPAPTEPRRLPDEIAKAGAEYESALSEAVVKGDVAEDDSQGHALAHNPALRAIQQRFIGFAGRRLTQLRDVLRRGADPDQRALAAQAIAYALDKQAVAADLADAVLDPAPEVRNNAMRALGIIAGYELKQPVSAFRVSPTPFVNVLSSLVWTDRNKAAFALMSMTSTGDPALLAELRKNALPSLIEMARWKSNYAQMSFFILGRIAGLKDEAIAEAWNRHDVDSIISAAQNVKP